MKLDACLFLQRKYEEAIEEFQKTVAVDPEDLNAHYNMMLLLPRAQKFFDGGERAKVVFAVQGG